MNCELETGKINRRRHISRRNNLARVRGENTDGQAAASFPFSISRAINASLAPSLFFIRFPFAGQWERATSIISLKVEREKESEKDAPFSGGWDERRVRDPVSRVSCDAVWVRRRRERELIAAGWAPFFELGYQLDYRGGFENLRQASLIKVKLFLMKRDRCRLRRT